MPTQVDTRCVFADTGCWTNIRPNRTRTFTGSSTPTSTAAVWRSARWTTAPSLVTISTCATPRNTRAFKRRATSCCKENGLFGTKPKTRSTCVECVFQNSSQPQQTDPILLPRPPNAHRLVPLDPVVVAFPGFPRYQRSPFPHYPSLWTSHIPQCSLLNRLP